MSELQIRILTPGDWHLYKSLRLNSLLDSPDSFGSEYARENLFTDAEWQSRLDPSSRAMNALPLVAEIGAQPVGMAWGLIQEPALRVAHIYQMWVSPDSRGNGIGMALVEQIKEWARVKGCDRLVLTVTIGNEAATGLYLSSGFLPLGETEQLREGSELRMQPMVLELRGPL